MHFVCVGGGGGGEGGEGVNMSLQKLAFFSDQKGSVFAYNVWGCVAQSAVCLTQEPEVLGSIPGPAIYFCFSC